VDAEDAMTVDTVWTEATVGALAPLADPAYAAPMAAYMKQVAPFLGIKTPERRAALRAAWTALPAIDAGDLAVVFRRLWDLPEREYQYAACDLLARHRRTLPAGFLADPVQHLLTTKPWWDTVDSLGTAAVTPVVDRHPEQVALMWSWLESGDRWLIRAAIQHQRGLGARTDLDCLFAMCEPFVADREFFIAKAIGWALRDVTAWDAEAVQGFVDAHPDLSAVARREALRGLARSARP
jgi:3-methyladenine DNA glycosylase AlkD